MEITRFHIDQAMSMYKLRKRTADDLKRIRAHYTKIMPLAKNPFNRRDSAAIIAAIDELLS